MNYRERVLRFTSLLMSAAVSNLPPIVSAENADIQQLAEDRYFVTLPPNEVVSAIFPSMGIREGEKALFTLTVREGCETPFLGVSTEKLQQPDGRTLMLGFGGPGNLTNGYGTMELRFGVVNRVIDMLVAQEDGQVRVWFACDGCPFEEAFCVDAPRSDTICPVVQGSNSVVEISKSDAPGFPWKRQRERKLLHLAPDSRRLIGLPLHFSIEKDKLGICSANDVSFRIAKDQRLVDGHSTGQYAETRPMMAEARFMEFANGSKIHTDKKGNVSLLCADRLNQINLVPADIRRAPITTVPFDW